MRDFKFDLKETENYYLLSLRKFQTGNPNWDSSQIITREDVANYIKNAENILECWMEKAYEN